MRHLMTRVHTADFRMTYNTDTQNNLGPRAQASRAQNARAQSSRRQSSLPQSSRTLNARSVEDEIAHLDWVATKLDAAFRIPGTRIRLGYDSLLGLIPGVGDTLTLLPGLYIIGRARGMGVDRLTLMNMALNSGIDLAIGAIPLIGDLFDVGYRSNMRNVALIRKHFHDQQPPDLSPRTQRF